MTNPLCTIVDLGGVERPVYPPNFGDLRRIEKKVGKPIEEKLKQAGVDEMVFVLSVITRLKENEVEEAFGPVEFKQMMAALEAYWKARLNSLVIAEPIL